MTKKARAALAAWMGGLVLGTEAAHGFCGTYVGPAGSEVVNDASLVAIVFQDDRVTLTLANDYEGDVQDFGLLIPVPSTLALDDVRIVDPSVLDGIDAYTAPRVVSYSCDDVQSGGVSYGSTRKGSHGCGSPPPRSTPTTTTTTTTSTLGSADVQGVVVAETGRAGEYELALVDPTDGQALGEWASAHGFEIDPDSQVLLDGYAEGGAWFLAARVSLDELRGRTWLSPLQLSYAATSPGLPVLLGTASADVEQDLVVFALNAAALGWMGVANYREVPLPSECLYEGDPDAVADWYDGQVSERLGAPTSSLAGERATWAVEYGWLGGGCDPCAPSGPLSDALAQDLGWDGLASEVFVSRLRLRFGPHQVDEDLVLYFSQFAWQSQIRLIEHAGYLEPLFPLCEGGWGAGGETCGDETFRQAPPGRGPTRLPVLGLPEPAPPAGAVQAGIGLLALAALRGLTRRR